MILVKWEQQSGECQGTGVLVGGNGETDRKLSIKCWLWWSS